MNGKTIQRKSVRKTYSIKKELIAKSRESALTAIQVFNNPLIQFKSETFIMLMVVAWTYMMHAYYRSNDIEYRYFDQGPKRRHFHRTQRGAYKYWELERCLNAPESPIDRYTANNIRFVIGLRHEIEHQMTHSLDSVLSGRYQACALNYNYYIKKLFGADQGIESHLGYSLQFVDLVPETPGPGQMSTIPSGVRSYISEFDSKLSEKEFNDERYSYRLIFTRKLAAKPNQADKVIEFIDPKSELGQTIEKEYWVTREVERPKYLPKAIVNLMKDEGFSKFGMQHHTDLWKSENAKAAHKGFGVQIGNQWYWYEKWLNHVRKYCAEQDQGQQRTPLLIAKGM